MGKRTVIGPYKVINIGTAGVKVYEVVSMIDANSSEGLRPRYTTSSRQAAYGKALRLNKRWQEEYRVEDNYSEMLAQFAR